MPAHRNASQGSRGCVPLTNVSNTKRRGERYGVAPYHPPNSHRVSWSVSKAHHCSAAALIAASNPMRINHRVRNKNSSPPTMK